MCYEAYRYAADGHAGEPGDGAVIARGSIDDCRGAIRSRRDAQPGSIDRGACDARWSGTCDDVEAYHESDVDGCGGWAIRPAAEQED